MGALSHQEREIYIVRRFAATFMNKNKKQTRAKWGLLYLIEPVYCTASFSALPALKAGDLLAGIVMV